MYLNVRMEPLKKVKDGGKITTRQPSNCDVAKYSGLRETVDPSSMRQTMDVLAPKMININVVGKHDQTTKVKFN
jgi:hypothetical protein